MATTPYPFVAGAVLTASQLNSTFNVPVNTQSASYVLLASDAGKRVRMTAAGATTITVNTSLFAAGDNLRIENGPTGGVCTVTAGTATVVSAGPLAIPVNGGGTLFFTSASAATWFPDAVTATPGGLTLITSASFSAVTSVSFPTSTFTTTYRNYKVLYQVDSTSANGSTTARLRASGTDNSTNNYRQMEVGITQGNTTTNNALDLQTSFSGFGQSTSIEFDIFTPQAAVRTTMVGGYVDSNTSSIIGRTLRCQFVASTQFDSMTFLCSTGNFTGSYRVYGYAE